MWHWTSTYHQFLVDTRKTTLAIALGRGGRIQPCSQNMTKTYPKTCFWAEPYGHSEDSAPVGHRGILSPVIGNFSMAFRSCGWYIYIILASFFAADCKVKLKYSVDIFFQIVCKFDIDFSGTLMQRGKELHGWFILQTGHFWHMASQWLSGL